MNFLRVGVIGIGNMGSAHASCIAKEELGGLKLSAVCDIDKDKLTSFKNIHSGVEVYTNYKELLQSKTVDAVIIAVPHPLHADIAIEALENDIHVLLEKPVDVRVSKAEKLNQVANNCKKVFAIMFNQRTNWLFNKAREIVKNGELGELKRTVWVITNWYRTQHYYNSGDWRATWAGEGGGVLLNQCPHNLDIWQWICGMPKTVTAFCDIAKYHNIEVEDDATIFTRYTNGAVGIFTTSTGEFPGTNRLEISGTLGKIVLENGFLKWWKLKENEREICNNSSESMPAIDFDYVELKAEKVESAHKGILQNFANAILNGEELISPGIEGINELTISNAAYLSSWQGNKEISLPFNCTDFDAKLDELIQKSNYKKTDTKTNISTAYSKRWQVNW